MDEGFKEQAIEIEVESHFWQDFAAKLRDALTPYGEPLWRENYSIASPAGRIQREERHWLNNAIERASTCKSATRADIDSLIWLRRYIYGEVPRDPDQIGRVQDSVAGLTQAETGKIGEHYELPIVEQGMTTHSPDFRSVRWFGRHFSFTVNQAPVVQVLWGAWENRTADVGDETLLQATDHEAPPTSLRSLFRQHPAWGTMIVAGGSKGSHRLAEPPKNLYAHAKCTGSVRVTFAALVTIPAWKLPMPLCCR